MMDVLREGGPVAQLTFWGGMGGILLVVLACGIWYQRRDLSAAALQAVDRARNDSKEDLDPLTLFKAGRSAALMATHPPSGILLRTVVSFWALVMVAMGLAALLRQPDAMVVAEVVRGNLDLPPQLDRQVYFGLVSRALVAGSMATLMVVPTAMIAGLSMGFLRSWLLGNPLDQALLAIIAEVDPEGQVPDMVELKADITGCARRRWTVTGWLTGPLWFFIKGKTTQGWAMLILLALGVALALGVWYLPARFIWGGEPLISGTNTGVIWHYLREPLVVLFTLPVWIYTGTRGHR